jgi:hypothetical protein
VQAISKFGFIGRSVDENLFLVPAWFLVSTGTGEIVRTEKGANFYEHDTFVNIYDSLKIRD